MSAKPPQWAPTQSPTPLTTTITDVTSSLNNMHNKSPQPSSKIPIDFSPPLIAMVIVAAAGFLLVTFSRHLFPPVHRLTRRYRRWRRRRLLRPHFPPSDVDSFSPPPPYDSSDGFFVYSTTYGLDDSVIKKIPLTIYKPSKSDKVSSKNGKLGGLIDQVEEFNDCAVCLLEFEDGDYVRTLPLCYHSFHVDCIDIWLKSHATCPLCRAGVFFPPLSESPMTPLMAARIRPSLDLESTFMEPLQTTRTDDLFSPDIRRSNRRELDFLLKRSHSFSFERSFPSERLVLGAATTPHRHNDQNRRRSFWMKRPSSTPFNSAMKSRVLSLRIKSPSLFRRRSYFPMSESSASLRCGIGSSRRLKSVASPLFGVPGVFSSSRMRLGDPEALISPERYGRR